MSGSRPQCINVEVGIGQTLAVRHCNQLKLIDILKHRSSPFDSDAARRHGDKGTDREADRQTHRLSTETGGGRDVKRIHKRRRPFLLSVDGDRERKRGGGSRRGGNAWALTSLLLLRMLLLAR